MTAHRETDFDELAGPPDTGESDGDDLPSSPPGPLDDSRERPTLHANKVPSPEQDPVPYDPEADSEAPRWVKELFRERKRDMETLARIERNLESNLRENRRVSRRVAEHGQELEDLRDDVAELKAWRDRFERGDG